MAKVIVIKMFNPLRPCADWLALAPMLISSWAGAASPMSAPEVCPRPAPGAVVPEPEDLRSVHGVLTLDLSIANERTADGVARYCYRAGGGQLAPTLRVHPGDLVHIRLTNHLVAPDPSASDVMASGADHPAMAHHHDDGATSTDPCLSGAMRPTSTNLHFHGMTMPPLCHQDEVLKTSVQPGEPPFEYRFRVPDDEPPGLYWYHPHIHGYSAEQVLGGASGALIVEGLERAIPQVAGLAERVLVLRDLVLLNPQAPPSKSEPVVAPQTLDIDGDVANNHTGYGKPARDVSVNFVPVPYPDYPPARIVMRPKERQLWRVLNAASVTYMHLSLLYDKVAQPLSVVAIDGVPMNQDERREGQGHGDRLKTVDHLVIPPGGRAEFIVEGPALGVKGLLITRTVDTGQDGENDPNRALATVVASTSAAEPRSRLPRAHPPLPEPTLPWIGSVTPVRTRKLYLSERRADPSDPRSRVLFFITEEGKEPKVFDPSSGVPDLVVKQGDVEDWVIENRSLELHDFHIHQLHFQLRQWYGYEVDEPFLRDTVSVPFFDNHMTAYPSVTVRMDFRDPNIVGTFVYHCHLLDHEDGGMMGIIRVDPAADPSAPAAPR